MQDAVTHRLATLLDRDAMSCTRIPHWRDGARAVPDFWRLGSGLGTYRYVYCLYQQRPDQAWYYHAENQYLETLVESGVVGFGLLLAAIGLVGAAAWRLVLTKGDIASLALGVAGLFALASQAIHGFFDFGLYMPANLMLLALLCGAVCGRAAHVGSRRSAMPLAAVPVNRFATACLAGVFVPLLLCGLAEARKVQTVETALKDTREHALVTLTPPSVEPDAAWGQGTQSRNAPRETRGLYAAPGAQKPHSSSAAILLEDIRRLEQAVKSRPDDAEAHARLARLWINLYRVRALEQLRAEKIAGVDDAKLWDYTSPRRLHGAVHHLARAAAKDQLVQLRQHPLVSGNLRPAIRHLTLARSACSLLPNVHLELAQLSGLVGEPGLDQIHLDRAIRLSPGDPAMLLMCGLLELQAGRNGLAAKTWRDSIRLDRSRLDRILAAAEKQFDARSLIEDVLPDSPELLLELARTRYTQEKGAELHKMLIDRADELIARAELPEPQRCRLQGLVFAMRKEHGRAIDRYYRAVELRRQDPGWRYELALALTGASRLQEAHQQAILCARMAPGNGQYQALLRELNHRLLAEASP
jgi:Tfp pilus assembly protein PilF